MMFGIKSEWHYTKLTSQLAVFEKSQNENSVTTGQVWLLDSRSFKELSRENVVAPELVLDQPLLNAPVRAPLLNCN